MNIDIYTLIDDFHDWIVEKEWTSSRFTWGEGYNEYDYEEGTEIERVDISIYVIDHGTELLYSHYAEEIKQWLFEWTIRLYDDNLPVHIWTHIKHRQRMGEAVVTLRDMTKVTFKNIDNLDAFKENNPQCKLVDTVHEEKKSKFTHKY